MHDQLMQTLALETAAEIPIVYAEKSKANVSEMHHLQPATNRVLERLAPTWDPAPSLEGRRFGDMLGWIGLGHVDNVLHWPDSSSTFLELKCGYDLSACVWDAVKLAAGVLNGNATDGYMLASAPRASWESPCPGSELFQTRRWNTLGPEIRGVYRKWWYRWQEEVVADHPNRHLPGRVAGTFQTEDLGAFPFVVNGTPWELRLARVDSAGAEWAVWRCVGQP